MEEGNGLLEGLSRTVNRVLLHVLGHVRVLDHRLAFRHLQRTMLVAHADALVRAVTASTTHNLPLILALLPTNRITARFEQRYPIEASQRRLTGASHRGIP